MRRMVGCLGIAMVVVLFVAYFMGYNMFTFDPKTGPTVDIFGRQLTEAPGLVQAFLGPILVGSKFWAGLGWFLIDCAVLMGGVATGIWLAKWGFGAKN
jgi:hypothetical protein